MLDDGDGDSMLSEEEIRAFQIKHAPAASRDRDDRRMALRQKLQQDWAQFKCMSQN